MQQTLAARALAAGETTAAALTRACLARVEQWQPQLNAFVTVTADLARQQAEEADDRRRRGAALGPLDGVPIAVKDNICVAGVRTTCASHMLDGPCARLADFVPPYDATVWARLRKAGAVLVGKTNLDEFGMGAETWFSSAGPTFHPAVGSSSPPRRLSPGGSSGGSAVAVATLMAYGALGTDTGGSVRAPASYCGVYGFKPTYGALSRHGLVAYASSLDCPGVFARSLEDLSLMLAAVDGPDPRDAMTTTRTDVPANLPPTDGSVPLVVGIPQEYLTADLPGSTVDRWQAAIDALTAARQQRVVVRPVSLPHTAAALPAYYIIAAAEASSNLARYDGIRYGPPRKRAPNGLAQLRGEAFGPEVQRRILMGTFALSARYYDSYFAQAQRVRRRVLDDFANAFAEVDVLLTPTTPTTAPPARDDAALAEAVRALDTDAPHPLHPAVAAFLGDVFTVPASLAGLPAVSVPGPTSTPGSADALGLQVIGPARSDRDVLRVAAALERAWAPA